MSNEPITPVQLNKIVVAAHSAISYESWVESATVDVYKRSIIITNGGYPIFKITNFTREHKRTKTDGTCYILINYDIYLLTEPDLDRFLKYFPHYEQYYEGVQATRIKRPLGPKTADRPYCVRLTGANLLQLRRMLAVFRNNNYNYGIDQV